MNHGVTDGEKRKVLIQFLNDLGVAIYFGSFDLADTSVLDPHWVTEAVYRIINAPGLAEEHGILALKDLKSFLKEKRIRDFIYPQSKHRYIVSLMKKFELCYSLDGDRVLLPDLLPVVSPEVDHPMGGVLRLRIDYEFLPRMVIPRFIVRRHREIAENLQWRTGVVLEQPEYGAKAFIKADYEERRIDIAIWGGARRDYLAAVRDTFRDINSGFKRNKIREGLACNCEVCERGDNPHFHDYQVLIKYFVNGIRDIPCPESVKTISIASLLGDVMGTQEGQFGEVVTKLRDLKDKTDTPETLFQKAKGVVSGVTASALYELIKLLF